MAKKRVNVFERHLEKGVFGLAALVFAGTFVLFLVMSPNKVTIGAQEAGPGEVDGILKAKADELAAAVRAARPEQAELPEWSKRWAQYADGPLKTSNLPETLARAVDWHAPILDVGDVSLRAVGAQSVALADVIRPGKPRVVAGRNLIEEQPIEPLSLGPGRRGPRPRGAGALVPVDVGGGMERPRGVGGRVAPPPIRPAPRPVRPARRLDGGGERKDVNWASVFFTFDRPAQREAFTKARYSPLLKEVVFAPPELQRRSLRGGRWTEWESVETFEPYQRPQIPAAEPGPTGQLTETSALAVQDFVDTIRSAQPEVMRPDFPLVVSGKQWEIPRLDGIDADVFDAEGDARFDELIKRWDPGFVPAGDGGGAGQWWIEQAMLDRQEEEARREEERRARLREGKSPEEVARLDAQDSLAEGERLFNAGRFDEAQILVSPLPIDPLLPAGVQQRAQDLLDKIDAELKKAREKEEARQRMQLRQEQAMRQAGIAAPLPLADAPVTLLWAHDLTVRPGAVYQYRARVRIFNVYAGRPEQLEDDADALKVVMAGDWSEPSDPVEIPPDVHFFLTSTSGDTASVRVYKWFMGQWVRDDFPVEIGTRIGGIGRVTVANLDAPTSRNMEVDFASDYVAVDLDPNYEMNGNGAGQRRRPKTTTALIYLDARNELRQRLHEDDKNSELKRELERQVFRQRALREPRDPVRGAPPVPRPRPRRR